MSNVRDVIFPFLFAPDFGSVLWICHKTCEPEIGCTSRLALLLFPQWGRLLTEGSYEAPEEGRRDPKRIKTTGQSTGLLAFFRMATGYLHRGQQLYSVCRLGELLGGFWKSNMNLLIKRSFWKALKGCFPKQCPLSWVGLTVPPAEGKKRDYTIS